MTTTTATARRYWSLPTRWLASGLAFPPAGLLAITVVSAVDRPSAAVIGGLIAGIGIGAGQWLALRSEAPGPDLGPAWIVGTAGAMAVGLSVGAAAVRYGTSTGDLVAMGLITGAAIGPVQGRLLRRLGLTSTGGAAAWAVLVPALWALGWFVTASAGVDVERQYTHFGLTGALASSALGALVLNRLIRRP